MINVLHLGLSYACNMKCKHCFVNKNNDKLKLQDYKDIIDTMYEQGLMVLYYTYGEPLLSNYFEPITNYAKQKGLVQILMTNGSVLTDEKIQIIKNNKVSNIFISLDNINEKIHDQNRGFRGAYNLAIKAINKCVQNNIKVGIATTVNENNVECLQDIYDFAIKNNVKIISFLRERRNCKIVKMPQNLEEKYIEFFIKCMKNTNQINVNFHDPLLLPIIKQCHKNGQIDDITYEKFYNMNLCHYKNTLSISPDGLVRCCNLASKPFGDLKKETLNNIVKGVNSVNENYVCCTTLSK